MSSAIEVLKKFRYTDENVSINQLHNALDEALLALQSQTEFELLQKRNAFLQEQKEDNRKQGAIEQKEKDRIDFIRLEILPKSKKKQYRVFFRDGTEQVFELEGVEKQE